MIYYAKSPDENNRKVTVGEHCRKVAELAKKYGEVFCAGSQCEMCGLLHDFGKYSVSFQNLLLGLESGIDHAICGAVLLRYLSMYKEKNEIKFSEQYMPLIEAVNAHHDGLKPYKTIGEALNQNWLNSAPIYLNNGKQSALCGREQYESAIKAYLADFPKSLSRGSLKKPLPCHESGVSRMLYSRMLLSCLCDADYTVSGNGTDSTDELDAEKCLADLTAYRENLRKISTSNVELNKWRDLLYDACGKAASSASGLFTLTAPTGTGKTLALMNFALRHMQSANKRRIILVLPYLSLTEQSAEVYQNFLPEALQDHSQKSLDDTAREHAAKWDAPLIITTSVKFFEALFASRPTDCRKLHNIADSIVVFDEAQSLPAKLTDCTLRAVKTLCEEYGCTVVFSTATQPDFDAINFLDWKPREILKDSAEMYRALNRTNLIWNIDRNQETSLETIAEEMRAQNNVCTIVNMREHARKLFTLLKEGCRSDEIFFLTTNLCPAHRSALIAQIRERQKNGLPCRVVSTQCIEAGVDLDFDVLYRALAPLESIIQAAGRCNRNGRNAHGGTVTVFVPDEINPYPDEWYKKAAKTVVELNDAHPIDIQNPEHIKEYYQILLRDQNDAEALKQGIILQDYEAVDKAYKLIPNQGYKVLVPYAGKEDLYKELCAQAISEGIDAKWLRAAAPITVNTFTKLPQGGYPVENLIYKAKRGRKAAASDVYILCTGNFDCYKPDMGLQFADMEVLRDLQL